MSAVDLAGNVSQPLQQQLVLDDKAPETVPTNLSASLSFSGREASLSWSVDVNAGSYNLYYLVIIECIWLLVILISGTSTDQ